MNPNQSIQLNRKLPIWCFLIIAIFFSFSNAEGYTGTGWVYSQPTAPDGVTSWPEEIKNDKVPLVHNRRAPGNLIDNQLFIGGMAFALKPTGNQEMHAVSSLASNRIVDNEAQIV